MITRQRTYSNGEVTVIWEPARCIHSSSCAAVMPQQFPLFRHPAPDLNGIPASLIAAAVSQCPSGALSMVYNDQLTSQYRGGLF